MEAPLRNIYLTESQETFPYTPIPSNGEKKQGPQRDRMQHAQYLETKFNEIWEKGESLLNTPSVASHSAYAGIYIEVKGKENYELITKSLEHLGQNVRLCNVRHFDEIIHTTVFIPHDKKGFFLKKINEYREKEANKKVIESIDEISLALVEELWVGDKAKMPVNTPKWCEVWLIYYKEISPHELVDRFFQFCGEEGIQYKSQKIIFPERVVVGVFATEQEFLKLQYRFGLIAEIRAMATPASFFVRDLNRTEQNEWMKELLGRTSFNPESNVSVCILDQGINQGHPLLSEVLIEADMHTIFADGIKSEISRDGHGTAMAGIAAYYNLEAVLESSEVIKVNHRLESVRMLDLKQQHLEELYGAKTAEAILLPEIESHYLNRAICMAITSSDSDVVKDGRPSSWSGALDGLAVGRYESEETDHRLILVSAGNTTKEEIEDSGGYEEAVSIHSVEDPGQAWNVLTVGAFTEKIFVSESESYDKFHPIAPAGTYSPFTSTSLTWDNIWPIKPDIVLEGGNLAYNKDEDSYSEMEELQLLTTNKDFLFRNPFTTTSMTSSATAQASWIAATIMHEYPDLWPETVRALIVHSATWPEPMLRKVFGSKKERELKRSDYRQLLKTVGYGVPNAASAIHCLKNSVNMIIEEELQPFVKEGSVKIKEMHLHEIPWPDDILLDLGETPVEMRVTLSYFIEPAPGEVGWKDKYRYPSHRMYFDVNNATEDKKDFLRRINLIAREAESNRDIVKNDSDRWLIGVSNREVGSIHSDIWRGTASGLAENRYVAIYPGTGWWYSRPHLKRYDSKGKYSLIVSISTPDENIDLYTPISTKVGNKVPIKTEIKY